ncbi:MAG: hypothetical protein B7X44_09175 [Halothiobacillus sp. 15-55-196]|nr:MAG: hypothetical protein B7X44_09175 [Halothiobacillus sp. 15-55-196]
MIISLFCVDAEGRQAVKLGFPLNGRGGYRPAPRTEHPADHSTKMFLFLKYSARPYSKKFPI